MFIILILLDKSPSPKKSALKSPMKLAENEKVIEKQLTQTQNNSPEMKRRPNPLSLNSPDNKKKFNKTMEFEPDLNTEGELMNLNKNTNT